MPIVVQHDTDPALPAIMSYLIGQGQYAQRTQAQQPMPNPLLQALQQSQQGGQPAGQAMPMQPLQRPTPPPSPGHYDGYGPPINPLVAQALGGNNRVNDTYSKMIDHLLTLGAQQQQTDAQGEEANARLQAQQSHLDQREQFRYANDSAAAADKQTQAIQIQMSKLRPKMTQEGVRIWGELVGKLRGIQSQRGMLPPEQYAKAMAQWQDEYNNSGVDQYVQPPPDPQQQWQQNSVRTPEGTYVYFDPTGKPHYHDPPQTEAHNIAMAGLEDKRAQRQHAHDLMLANQKIKTEVWKQTKPDIANYQKMGASPGKDTEGNPIPAKPEPDFDAFNKAVDDWMQKAPIINEDSPEMKALNQNAIDAGAPLPQGMGNQPVPPQTEQPDDDTGDAGQPGSNVDPQFDKNGPTSYLYGNQMSYSDPQALADSFSDAPTPQQMEDAGQSAQGLIEPLTGAATPPVAIPKTEAEYEALPKGTPFRHRDGTIRIKQ